MSEITVILETLSIKTIQNTSLLQILLKTILHGFANIYQFCLNYTSEADVNMNTKNNIFHHFNWWKMLLMRIDFLNNNYRESYFEKVQFV